MERFHWKRQHRVRPVAQWRVSQPHSLRVNSFAHSTRSWCGPWGVQGEFGRAWHFGQVTSFACQVRAAEPAVSCGSRSLLRCRGGRALPIVSECRPKPSETDDAAGKLEETLVAAFAWLHQFKRLRIRYERRADPRSAYRRRGLRRGRPRIPRIDGTASSSGRSWVTSWRLPPVSVTASGVPWRSTIIRWCLEPGRDDAGQCDPVRHGEPPGGAMSARGSCWQQRGYPVPQFVGDKVLGHDAEACQRIRLSPPGQLDILPA